MKSHSQQITKQLRTAQSAMQAGRLREAHQHCLAILKLDQTCADAWFFCGVIAAHNGQLPKAIDILGNALKLAPENTEYRAELGKQLLALNQPERALLEAERTFNLSPAELPTLFTLGTVFSHTGEHEKALLCFERATGFIKESPARAAKLPTQWQAELYFNTAASRQFAGQFEAAEKDYEKVIALQPHHFKAHFALSTLRKQTTQSNHMPRLESIRGNVSSPRDQLQLGHAMAKEQEDLGLYAEALQSLNWAKRAQAEDVSYSADADAQLFAQVQKLFTADLIGRQSTGCDSSEPIFIVGMPRTGTTLVEQVLSSHSQVYAAGELQNFPLQVQRMTGSTAGDVVTPQTFGESPGLNMAELGSLYITSTRPRTGHTPHFIDKLPLNFLYLGLIKLALPNAKLVCLRRDPMDTCLSNYRQLFAINFRHYHYNYDLLDCGRYYIQFDSLMRHWHDVMPGAVHEVRYEALVENPEQVSRELLSYCELPWEDQCLAFHQRKTTVATPSAVQVRQGIYTSSVKRWQRYGDAMQPLYELLESAGFYP